MKPPPTTHPRVCLVTTGQPSTNPRLVKEADALAEVGCDVHVVAAHWASWAADTDRELLASRPWTYTFVDWRQDTAPVTHAFTRIRHWTARRLAQTIPAHGLVAAAASRVGPELVRAACQWPADLYIAHNLGALPAALSAASRHGGPAGFDAEDFHSGQLSHDANTKWMTFIQSLERHLLPQCAYVTAASSGIADAYQCLCNIRPPTTVLNVFPLADRPATFRPYEPHAGVRLYWFSQVIGPNRGLEDAVRAMGLLRGASVCLHLRGLWQAGYERVLRTLAAECGVGQERIVSHPPASPDEMVRLAAQADIGLALEPAVNVNNDLAVSNKLFTYVLAGTAVVASNTSGQSEAAASLGIAAQTYTAGSAESLARALGRWTLDRDALVRARTEAWRLGESRFNWNSEKHVFLNVAEAALLAGRRRAEPASSDRRLSHA